MNLGKPLFNWLGLVVVAGIVAVLARNPQIVANFFNGSSKLVGTALGAGK